jgi:hypothetical protein
MTELYSERPATDEELVEFATKRTSSGYGKLHFKHFTWEQYAPHAKNGVTHRQYSAVKKFQVIDGKVHVRYRGELEPLKGLAYVNNETGKIVTILLKLDSPYLSGW